MGSQADRFGLLNGDAFIRTPGEESLSIEQVIRKVADNQPLLVSRKQADDTRVEITLPEGASVPQIGADAAGDDFADDPARLFGFRRESATSLDRDPMGQDVDGEISYVFGNAEIAPVDQGARLGGAAQGEGAACRGAQRQALMKSRGFYQIQEIGE